MVTKRKAAAVAKEDRSSNAISEAKAAESKLRLHADNSKSKEAKNVDTDMHPNSNVSPLKDKKSRVTSVVVRRSGRLKSPVSTGQGAETIVEHIDLVETEKEEALQRQQVNTLPVGRKNNSVKNAPKFQQVSTLPVEEEKNLEKEDEDVHQVSGEPVVIGRNVEEKIDYLVSVVDEFKTSSVKQVNGRPNEGLSPGFSYKSLYIASQKKIEALVEENYELVRKLEFARGKIEAYENMKNAEGASREVILVSNMGKAATEATPSLSRQEVKKCSPQTTGVLDAGNDSRKSPKQKKQPKKNVKLR